MKYKDYYQILGVGRDADTDAIKKAYRKLAHKYHPDVSKDPAGEEKFKEIADAYQTLKDPDKRAAYDQLGRHQPGQEFQPPPDWGKQFGETPFSSDDIDLSELFAGLAGGRRHAGRQGGTFQMPAAILREPHCKHHEHNQPDDTHKCQNNTRKKPEQEACVLRFHPTVSAARCLRLRACQPPLVLRC